jgi:WD40 repeat protein
LGIWELDFTKSPGGAAPIQRERQLDVGTLITQLRCDPTQTWIAALSTGMDLLAPEPDVLIYRCEDLWNAEGSPPPISLNAKRAEQLVFLSGQQDPTLAIGEIGGSVAIYSIGAENQLLQRLEPDAFNAVDHIEAMVAVNVPTGDAILAGSSEGSLLWWNYGDTNEHQRQRFDGVAISCVDLSADGRWAVAGSDDGSLWLWDTHAGENKGAIQLVAHGGEIDAIQLTPDQHWLMAGCDDGAIRSWDLRHLKLMTSIAETRLLKIEQDESTPEPDDSTRLTSKADSLGPGAWVR